MHSEYYLILTKLIQYYKNYSGDNQIVHFKLENFLSEQIDVPNVQLNLEPICVEVKDIKTCKTLIDFTLQLLSESIPINSLHIGKTKQKQEELFYNVLYMLENFSTDMKLVSFKFFSDLIIKYNQVSVYKFQKSFLNIYNEFLNCLEAIVKTLEVLHDKGEISMMFLDKFNTVICNLVTIIASNYEHENEKTLFTICTTILETKSRVFNKDLKLYCLSLSKILEFPRNITSIKNRDACEVEKLSEYYYRNIMAFVKNNSETKEHVPLSDSWHYCEVRDVVWDALTACCDKGDDKVLISYHLNKCLVGLNILQKAQVNMQILSLHSEDRPDGNSLLQRKHCLDGLRILLKLISEHTNNFLQDKKYLKLVLDVLFSTIFPYSYCTRHEINIQIFNTLCNHLTSLNKVYVYKNKDNFDTLVLKYMLTLKLHLWFDSEENNQRILSLIYGFNEKKATDIYKEVS